MITTITTKSCSTCEHFPNDHHCAGCVWDENKGENTKWELKNNPIVIERKVLDKIRAEISDFEEEVFNRPNTDYSDYAAVRHCLEIIDKYKAETR